MKVFKSNDELKVLIKNGVLEFTEPVTCEFTINVDASIKSDSDITAWDIVAWDITVTGDITARNITATGDIAARNINFYALCFAFGSIKCTSIFGRRINAKFGCLDRGVEYITGCGEGKSCNHKN